MYPTFLIEELGQQRRILPDSGSAVEQTPTICGCTLPDPAGLPEREMRDEVFAARFQMC